MDENTTIRAVIEEFRNRRGLALLGYTQDKQHGFDAAFQDEAGHIWAFEVKGIAPSNAAREKYFDDGYARLPQIESGRKTLRDRQGQLTKTIPHYVSLAIPHHDHYVYHYGFFIHAFKRLGYGLYMVHADHVEEVVQPRLITVTVA